MQTNIIEVGTLIQLWCDAARYGVIIKINRVTFVVGHNLYGNTTYRIDSLDKSLNVHCGQRIFKGTLIPPNKMNNALYRHLLAHGLFKGKWWPAVQQKHIDLYDDFN